MQLNSDNVSSEQLGHLGLVAATIKELGLIEKIDSRLSLDESKGGIVSFGRRAAAMVLNGLGFMNSRLCMTAHFFQDKPVAQLLGDEITADNLNDDCLGRCLDKIAEYGTTKLYSELAYEVAREQNILGKRMHLDTTSFALQGRYDIESSDDTINPTYGYSKDHRPDLKQVMLSLTQGGEANIPLWMESLDGNSSDQTSFHETVKRIKQFYKEMEKAPEGHCFIVDAAFYVADKLPELDDVSWITRVPAKLKEAKELLSSTLEKKEWETFDRHYRGAIYEKNIYGVKQRWLLVESEHAFIREEKSFYRRINKKAQVLTKILWHLGNKEFKCIDDANSAIKPHLKGLKYHNIDYSINPIEKYIGRGRPKPGEEKQVTGYKIEALVSTSLEKIKHEKRSLGRFILATNKVSIEELNSQEILNQYKQQSCVESGFKFIKNNAFELSSFYLKTPKRIDALMMVMTLCLMVYNFAQYQMRKCIKENDDVVPNQVGKPIKNPTMKWVFELMQMIAVVTICSDTQKHRIITNVKKVHQRIIAYFGKHALEIYGLPPDLKNVEINHLKYKNINQWCET